MNVAGAVLVVLGVLGSPTDAVDPEETPTFDPNFEEVLRASEVEHAGDLDRIKTAGVLRVLTRNNSSHYFVLQGGQWGFQYELAKRFADELGVRLAMVVPPDRDSLIQALLDGEGDIIAAGMTITEKRAKRVDFSIPVYRDRRVVVTHEDIIKPLSDPVDLARFVLHLNFRSTTYSMAKAYQQRLGIPLFVHDVSSEIEMEGMLANVAAGEYEATIVDRNLLRLEQAAGLPLKARLPIGPYLKKGWAFRPSSPKLRRVANRFLAKAKKSRLTRILHNRYFLPSQRGAQLARETEFRADETGRISQYDELFKEVGKEVEIDWRLLAAVAYSESRFDPEARSRFGAVGLMQVMPSTARELDELGIEGNLRSALEDPKTSVRVAGHYLRWLMRQFQEQGVDKRQQIRFALAAYNAGVGHVLDARALAERTGRDPNRWFHNVEDAFLLKKDRRWHRRTKYGYCRADQVIAYVSRIQTRYDVYTRHVEF